MAAATDAKQIHAAVYQFLVRSGLNGAAEALLKDLHAVSGVPHAEIAFFPSCAAPNMRRPAPAAHPSRVLPRKPPTFMMPLTS